MEIILKPTGINNFHNSGPLIVRIKGTRIPDLDDRWSNEQCFAISKGQAKKIEKHFCGVTGCGCPKGGVVIETGQTLEGKIEYGLMVKK